MLEGRFFFSFFVFFFVLALFVQSLCMSVLTEEQTRSTG